MPDVGSLHACVRRAMVWCALSLTVSTSAYAGQSDPPGRQNPPDSNWTITFVGALSAPRELRGAAALPPPAPTFNTVLLLPTRQVSSWFYGDGPAMLSQVNAEQPFADSTIVPLDRALASGVFTLHRGANTGVRIGRKLSPRTWLEFGVDVTGGYQVREDARADIETTRASFEQTWRAFVQRIGPHTVTATANLTDGSTRQLRTTAALRFQLTGNGRQRMFVSVGGGVLSTTGTMPRIELEGQYAFTVGGLLNYDESDRVTIRADVARHVPGMIAGAAWDYDLTSRFGIRADMTLGMFRNPLRTRIDAAPSRQLTTGSSAVVATFTSPALLIYNREDGSLRSTLSGPAVDGFTVFDGLGIHTRVHAGAAIYVRF